MKKQRELVKVLRNKIKEISIKKIMIFPLDIGYLSPESVYRLADRMHKGKVVPLPIVNETTGHFIGNRAVLHAMRRLSYDKVPVLMLKLSREEEMALFQAFSKWA